MRQPIKCKKCPNLIPEFMGYQLRTWRGTYALICETCHEAKQTKKQPAA